jgi:nucleoid-associated protein YgaU
MAEKFEKAQISVYKSDQDEGADLPDKIEFMFNPESVRITHTLKPAEKKEGGSNAPSLEFTSGSAAKVEFGEILFDTFEQRESVFTKHVKNLEKLLQVDEKLHRPPMVIFTWGQGFVNSGSADGIYAGTWLVTAVDTNYIMFLPNGTPVRAKCKLSLTECPPEKARSDKGSPDTAHVRLVGRGDTLQAIAHSEYAKVGEWRRIAEANGIDDPLNLQPGQRLLIPPILK